MDICLFSYPMFVGMFPGEIECLVDCGTTHTILRHRPLFIELILYSFDGFKLTSPLLLSFKQKATGVANVVTGQVTIIREKND